MSVAVARLTNTISKGEYSDSPLSNYLCLIYCSVQSDFVGRGFAMLYPDLQKSNSHSTIQQYSRDAESHVGIIQNQQLRVRH